MDDAGGRRIGRFVLGEVLGRGGFGAVHRATDTALERTVAVKLLPAPDPAMRERAARELRLAGALQSPHIVPLLDVVEDGRDLALIYPYLDGQDLEQLLAAGPLALSDALAAARAVARGLAAAHARGIVHRDVKPSNILVPRRAGGLAFADAMVTDFGVLGELRADTGTTRAGLLVGTPAYMAPEQLSGSELSPATDVHGLAAVLFEMVYGRRLYRSTTLYELMQEILRGEPALPDEPPVPAALRALLLRSLSTDMARRPRDAAELLAELERLPASVELDLPAKDLQGDAPGPRIPAPRPRGLDPIGPGPGVAMRDGLRDTGWFRKGDLAADSRPEPTTGAQAAIVPRSGSLPRALAAAAALAAGALGFALLGSTPGWVLLGLGLVAAGVSGALAVHRHLSAKESEVARRASRLLTGAESRDSLTQSLAIRLEDLWEQCKTGEQEIVWHTVAMMVREYQDARDSGDRQSALMNLITLVGELQRRLSPWYVRHEKAVSVGVGVVGIASGLATTVIAVAKALA